MEKYNSGKIYKLINTIDDKVYIGSTITRLCDRMGNHRTKAKNKAKQSYLYEHMRNIGIEHFKIVLIKSFPCNSKDELEAEEYNEMSKYDKSILLNDNQVYKKKSEHHSQKVGAAQTGEKSHNWKFGSVWERKCKTSQGYDMHVWNFTWREDSKEKRVQFSIKKYGFDEAKQKALDFQKLTFPNMPVGDNVTN